MSRKNNPNHSGVTAVLITLIVIMIAATALIIFLCVNMVRHPSQPALPESVASLPLPSGAPVSPPPPGDPAPGNTHPPTPANF